MYVRIIYSCERTRSRSRRSRCPVERCRLSRMRAPSRKRHTSANAYFFIVGEEKKAAINAWIADWKQSQQVRVAWTRHIDISFASFHSSLPPE